MDASEIEEFRSRRLKNILENAEIDNSRKARIAYDTSVSSIRTMFSRCNADTIHNVEENAGLIVHSLLEDSNIVTDLLAVEGHDHYTFKHSVNVGFYATSLAVTLLKDKLTQQDIVKLSQGFFLHDLGMTRIEREVLNKTTPLTRQEQLAIRNHPALGYAMLEESGHLSPEAATIVMNHHERTDGSGYPNSRKGDEIPLYAKICTIADVFESLTSDRPYRKGRTPFQALKIMRSEMGREFDEDFFKAFVLLFAGEEG